MTSLHGDEMKSNQFEWKWNLFFFLRLYESSTHSISYLFNRYLLYDGKSSAEQQYESCVSKHLPSHPPVRFSLSASWNFPSGAFSPSWVPIRLVPGALPSHLFSYLLLFDALVDLGCGLLVGPKQTDDTGPFRVQDVAILVADHLVQLQDPAERSGRLEVYGGQTRKIRRKKIENRKCFGEEDSGGGRHKGAERYKI